jgi:hypothetical protein
MMTPGLGNANDHDTLLDLDRYGFFCEAGTRLQT